MCSVGCICRIVTGEECVAKEFHTFEEEEKEKKEEHLIIKRE